MNSLGRTRTSLRRYLRGTLPREDVESLRDAFESSFPGERWNEANAARTLRAVVRAHRVLRETDLLQVETSGDLDRAEARNEGERTLMAAALRGGLPAMNNPAKTQILLFPPWVAAPNLRRTRLIHEAFHPVDDGPGDSGGDDDIEHGPPPFDNAFSYQKFVSEVDGVPYNRTYVDRAVGR